MPFFWSFNIPNSLPNLVSAHFLAMLITKTVLFVMILKFIILGSLEMFSSQIKRKKNQQHLEPPDPPSMVILSNVSDETTFTRFKPNYVHQRRGEESTRWKAPQDTSPPSGSSQAPTLHRSKNQHYFSHSSLMATLSSTPIPWTHRLCRMNVGHWQWRTNL